MTADSHTSIPFSKALVLFLVVFTPVCNVSLGALPDSDDFEAGMDGWFAYSYASSGVGYWGLVQGTMNHQSLWCAAQGSLTGATWTGTNSHYDNNMRAFVEKTFDFSGHTNCYIEFEYYINTQQDHDSLVLYVNSTALWAASGEYNWDPAYGGSPKHINLSDYDGGDSVEIKFGFISDGSNNQYGEAAPGAFLDNIKVDGNLAFAVTSVNIDVDPEDPEKVVQGATVTGDGTMSGTGSGTVQYTWIIRKPDGSFSSSPVLSTQMTNGSAAIPTYSGFPTSYVGQHRTWVRIQSPNGPDDSLSNIEFYTVVHIWPSITHSSIDKDTVRVNEPFNVTILGNNEGESLATSGGIAVQVREAFTEGIEVLQHHVADGNNPGKSVWWKGESLGSATAEYLHIEPSWNSWSPHTEKMLTVTITPKKAGTYSIYTKMRLNTGSTYMRDPSGDTPNTDHQGEGTLYVGAVTVLPRLARVIIDTDPAMGDSDPDDITALIYALLSQEFCTVEGITYGYGNFGNQLSDPNGTRGGEHMLKYYELQLKKMLQVLHEAGAIQNDPPLYSGHKQSEIWQTIGYPGVRNPATDFIIEKIKNNPGEITVIALGTLTNIATAMAHYALYPNDPPENQHDGTSGWAFLRDCKELWVIGGGINKFQPVIGGECNIARDIRAADYVLSKAIALDGIPTIRLVPLDATWRLLITTNHITELPNTRIVNYLRFPLQWWTKGVNPSDNRQLDPTENFFIDLARMANAAAFAFPPYDTIGVALAVEPSKNAISWWWEDHKLYVHPSNGTTVNDTLEDRDNVRVFLEIYEGAVTEKILNKWSLPGRYVSNKRFIPCSEADYVRSNGGGLSGPQDVTLDYPLYCHLPVGVQEYWLDPNTKFRGRLLFEMATGAIPPDDIVTKVSLHVYCDSKSQWEATEHRVNIYRCAPGVQNAQAIWNSATEVNKYVDACDAGTLQAWRTVDLGSKACMDLENVVHTGGGQFALLLTEDGDDDACSWFDTYKDWKAYLEVDFTHRANFNRDCCIDFLDWGTLANVWHTECFPPSWCSGMDLDSNGTIEIPDLVIFAEHWLVGTTP